MHLHQYKQFKATMCWQIIGVISVSSLILAMVVNCSGGKREREHAGRQPSSDVPRSPRNEDRRMQKSGDFDHKTQKSATPPVNAVSTRRDKLTSRSIMPDDGYEACPDLNSKQLAKIAAET
ncbi:unnamed protein product [Cylicocyclus nassatus]|uniref:Uncharacterized protein n=1 Tax=Cylicocyclus nassatus TaxID=53992 RepID=A0AA36GHA4_CYLNA|nr:unnamed protein product [Cylicocyclus nassatus]